jgi:hypothetical protein
LKQAFKKASGGEMRRLPATILAGALLAAPAAAQSEADYPGKPVKVIVNVAPGGGVDTATRIVAERLRARLGQPFVVENALARAAISARRPYSTRRATATPCWRRRRRRSPSTAGSTRSSRSIRQASSRSR